MPEFPSILTVIFFGTLIIGALIQLYYYLGFFSKLAWYKPEAAASSNQLPPVSVIIAARNEYKNLEQNLHTILNQDYPEFEVVVVNDCSWDDSQKLLEYYQEQNKHLRICHLKEQEKYPTGKKFALTIGIKAAQYEHMLFTDADCVPAGDQWLKSMAGGFLPGKEIVLGYSPMKYYPNFLNLFVRFETFFTALFYLSAALNKRAFMGVGRNLAYTRELFFRNKGFAQHQHILSGDDDLHVNKSATSTNVAIRIQPESFMYTEPKRSYDAWQRQKTRHNSTGKYYKIKDQVLLGGYYSSLLIFYISIVTLLLLQFNWKWVLGIYAIRLLVQYMVFYGSGKLLRSLSLLWFLPILDLLYLIYIYIFGALGLFSRPKKVW